MPEPEEYSFAQEVWKRFRKSAGAMTGLLLIGLLCLTAVYAPLLANGLPWLVRINGTFSSPAFRELLAPDSTEAFVAKTFNWLFLLLPLLGILALLFRKRKKWFRISAIAAAVLLFLPFLQNGGYVSRTVHMKQRRFRIPDRIKFTGSARIRRDVMFSRGWSSEQEFPWRSDFSQLRSPCCWEHSSDCWRGIWAAEPIC